MREKRSKRTERDELSRGQSAGQLGAVIMTDFESTSAESHFCLEARPTESATLCCVDRTKMLIKIMVRVHIISVWRAETPIQSMDVDVLPITGYIDSRFVYLLAFA